MRHAIAWADIMSRLLRMAAQQGRPIAAACRPAAKSRSARVENVADVPRSLQNEPICFARR